MRAILTSCLLGGIAAIAQTVPADTSGVRAGPVSVEVRDARLLVRWPDEAGRPWNAAFSLDPSKELIQAIGTDSGAVVERARPQFWCSTGKRRGGWDQFFDFPPSHPEGTRSFVGVFKLTRARASTKGDRVEVDFEGLDLGIFRGAVRYTFYPGTRLMRQEAIVSTSEPDVAFYYDTGLRFMVESNRRAGGNMESPVSYFDTEGKFRTELSSGSERIPVATRYRTVAARTGYGSIAVFPAPHQYFMPRDFTTNLAHLWHSTFRGSVSLGIRQLADENWIFYPWMNAPPATNQRLGVFYLLSDRDPRQAIDDVLRFTNRDRFAPLPGYKTVSMHWHLAYTVQAMEKGDNWVPPFKPVLRDMGVDANIITDFHGDGHPRDLGNVRLEELDAYFRFTRAQSDSGFLLIPSEEANVHLGGHWAVTFPKPVYWLMSRPEGMPFERAHPRYGKVYAVGNEKEMLELVRRENGSMYQTHPRTKGSMGFPDKIRESEHFRDPRYWGAGWKAMPSDLSTPRLGERSLKLLDDMNNWGFGKRLLGEVDVFQVDHTHDLYAHMNVNYVKLDRLPAWNEYGLVLDRMAAGDFFITTGEVLLPDLVIDTSSAAEIAVKARLRWTFPLEFAEVVWGDGIQTHRKLIPLDSTRPFGEAAHEWRIPAPGWRWARVAVWDVAANGAMSNPVRRQ